MARCRAGEIELAERLLMVPQQDVVVREGPVGELEFHQGKRAGVLRPDFPDLVGDVVQPGMDSEPKDQRPAFAQVSSHVIDQHS